MSDEPKPEEVVQEVEQETTAEVRPGKKAKVAKKKAAEPQPEEAQAETALTTEAPAQAEAPPAETADSAPAKAGDDVFAQGVQALLRAEYDAADNFFGQALTNSRKHGDQAGQVAALEQLGHLCYLRGAIPQAQEYYQQASSMRGA